MPVDRGNPRRFHRLTEWKKVMDDFFYGQLRAHPTSVERRLRGGKSFVACAPQAFADPSAFIARWSYQSSLQLSRMRCWPATSARRGCVRRRSGIAGSWRWFLFGFQKLLQIAERAKRCLPFAHVFGDRHLLLGRTRFIHPCGGSRWAGASTAPCWRASTRRARSLRRTILAPACGPRWAVALRLRWPSWAALPA